MKNVFDNGWLKVFIPSSRAGWISIALCACSIVQLWRGDANTAWHLLEMAMLVEIADMVKPNAR